jgi:hypothetical protein
MSVTAMTKDPAGLIKTINGDIAKGTIATWEVEKSGEYTHKPSQYYKKAWFRPTIGSNQVVFSLVQPTGTPGVTRELFGIYHGRLVEELVSHYKTLINLITIDPTTM